jgi:hypothetical protein
MSGAIPLLPLCAIMPWKGTALLSPFSLSAQSVAKRVIVLTWERMNE